MNNNNDFFKGFSALDDEDKISAQNNSTRPDGRKEPTFGSESSEDSVSSIGQVDSQADSCSNAHENNYDGQMRDNFSEPEAYEANKLTSNGNTKDGQNSNGQDPKSTNEDKKASNSKKNLKRKQFLIMLNLIGIYYYQKIHLKKSYLI